MQLFPACPPPPPAESRVTSAWQPDTGDALGGMGVHSVSYPFTSYETIKGLINLKPM